MKKHERCSEKIKHAGNHSTVERKEEEEISEMMMAELILNQDRWKKNPHLTNNSAIFSTPKTKK